MSMGMCVVMCVAMCVGLCGHVCGDVCGHDYVGRAPVEVLLTIKILYIFFRLSYLVVIILMFLILESL